MNSRVNLWKLLSCWVLIACGASLPAREPVVINELMYHPVEKAEFNLDGTPKLDISADVHEYIELYNYGTNPLDLSGWKLTGGVSYSFPAGVTIQPGGYVVVAKNKTRLAAIAQYALREADLLGPYDGQLGNKDDSLRLKNSADETVDGVSYSSSFPWAIGANALGADEEWTGLNPKNYQFRGRSLERVSPTWSGNDPANWLASPIPGEPSPGRANAVTRATPLPVVTRLNVVQDGDEQPIIRNNQPVRIEATFSAPTDVEQVRAEYFVDNINLTNEAISTVSLASLGNGRFSGVIPGLPDRSVVRYRIRAARAGVDGVVSPRSDDPYPRHAYFVTPVRTSTRAVYDVFISTRSLNTMSTNVSQSPKRVISPDPPGNPRPSWNATEPAIFVHNGEVRDIRIRYHGSRYNRSAGRKSYKLVFPQYNPFKGQEALFETDKDDHYAAGHAIFRAAGLPSSFTQRVDMYFNTDGVLTRLEEQEYAIEMLEEYHQAQQLLNPGAPLEAPGELYKVVGTIEDAGEGPYGRGDGRLLATKSIWTPIQRYEWTYALQDHSWKGHTPFKEMIEAMWKARGDTFSAPKPNVAATRAFLEKYFDIDKTLTYIAVMNWMGPWDDTTQNHFLWRLGNGKWTMLPWDFDGMFGGSTSPTASIFAGEVGDPSNNFRGPNFFKDSFIKAYRQEIKERAFLLNNTVLAPDNIAALGFSVYRSFAVSRQASVNQQCGMGVFERPTKPVNQSPGSGAIALPPAVLRGSAYTHSATTPSPHTATLWEIRSASGNYDSPTFRIKSRINLTSIPIPFQDLLFGSTYFWRATYFDANDHPSITSAETSFIFGTGFSRQTNVVSLISIDASQTWKYDESGTSLGSAWKEPSYNDASWKAGPALLAVETAALPEPIRTSLTLGKTNYYFRTHFNLANLQPGGALRLKAVVDDGAIFYLNGKEIYRLRMPAGAVTSATFASANVGDAVYEGPFDVPSDALTNGDNVLAVEVHQSTISSSDIVFGTTLEYTTVTSTAASGSPVVLNEIMANNQKAVESFGAHPDWVELYNTSDATIDLSGHAFTDDILRPSRFVIPANTKIAARGYMTIWCDNATNAPGLHAGFELAASGQSVFLFGPDGDGLKLLDMVRFGLQISDLSISRVPNGTGAWTLSPPTPQDINLGQPLGAPGGLKINEWMASPSSGNDWFEIYNPNSLPVPLGGMSLSDNAANPTNTIITPLSYLAGHEFQKFEADSKLDKGADHVDFKLSGSGDSVLLFGTNRVAIDSVTFGFQETGVSQGRLPNGTASLAFFTKPSPGEPNFLSLTNIVINEVLSDSTLPYEDAIELLNVSTEAVDISGWFLSDSAIEPAKFQIPAGTVLAPGGYKVFYENQFNADPNAASSFALSSNGDDVYLSAATGNLPNGYRTHVSFDAAQPGRSFGRVVTSSGTDFAAQVRPSFGTTDPADVSQFRTGTGAANGGPVTGPIIINEIMYHPPEILDGTNRVENTELEFVELRNNSTTAAPLHDPAQPTRSWRVSGGISFTFPTNSLVPPNGFLLLVGFDPATNAAALANFKSTYAPAASVAILGPFGGKLNNDNDTITLWQPGLGTNDASILIDQVKYKDAAPWPSEADGKGSSLQRKKPNVYGNEALNWFAGKPSGGSENFVVTGSDSDGDGLPDAWELANQFDPQNPADGAEDPDHDGFTNLQEYLAGTDPRDANSRFGFANLSLTGSTATLTFQARTGRSYVVESSRDLRIWSAVRQVPPATLDEVVTVTDTDPAASARFYRLRLLMTGE